MNLEPAATPSGDEWASVEPTDARKDGVATAWNVVLGLDLALLAVAFIGSTILAFFFELDGGSPNKAAVWSQVVFNLLFFGLIPFLWAVYTRIGGFAGALQYLRMDGPRIARGIGEGMLLLLATFVGVAVLVAIYTAIVGTPEESPVIAEIVEVLDWPLIIALSLTAGVTEEILFRGVLQRWIGVWGQALFFGLAHAGYDTVINVAVPLLIGIGFGYVYKWRRNLWVVITAHFLYDLVILSVAKVYPDLGG